MRVGSVAQAIDAACQRLIASETSIVRTEKVRTESLELLCCKRAAALYLTHNSSMLLPARSYCASCLRCSAIWTPRQQASSTLRTRLSWRSILLLGSPLPLRQLVHRPAHSRPQRAGRPRRGIDINEDPDGTRDREQVPEPVTTLMTHQSCRDRGHGERALWRQTTGLMRIAARLVYSTAFRHCPPPHGSRRPQRTAAIGIPRDLRLALSKTCESLWHLRCIARLV